MIRAIATVLRGSILAQAIGFAVLPLLSRNFAPDAFGHFQAFQAVFSFLLIAVSLRYEVAILRASDGEELFSVIWLCAVLTVTTSILVGILLAFAYFLSWPSFIFSIGFPLWLIPVAMMVSGITQLLGYLATRTHAYNVISASKTSQGIANAALGSSLALYAPISSGLILADLVGRFANLVILFRGLRFVIPSKNTFDICSIKSAFFRFSDLSVVSLPSTLISTAGTSITPLFIYGSFDAVTSGQFGLVERSAGLPIALIVIAVSQVHMAHLASDLRNNTGTARHNFRRITLLLGCVAIVPAVLCAIYAETLYATIFGPGWTQAAKFAQLMMPAYLLALVTGGINMTLTVVGRQKTQFAWDASRFVAMALLWIIAPAMDWSIMSIIAVHSAIMSIFSIIMLVISYRALPDGTKALDETAGIRVCSTNGASETGASHDNISA